MRPLVPKSWTRWYGDACVETVKVEAAPVAEIEEALVEPVGAERRIAVDQRHDARAARRRRSSGRDDRVAADVVEAAAADVGAVADVGRVDVEVAEEASASARSVADAPRATSSRARSHCGWKRTMNASMISDAVPVAARSCSASSAVSAIGFSHSTCLPAAAA